MARFAGDVGYGVATEVAPGVWEDTIIRRRMYGDVLREQRNIRSDDKVLPEINVNNSISVVADAYANTHFYAIRFVEWSGALWTVTNVEVRSPRLILTIGWVYNGPKN